MEHAARADEAMDVIAAGGGPAGLMTAALLDVAGVRVEAYERGSEPTHAGDSRWPPGGRAGRKAPFSPPGLNATLTGISGIGSGADSPSWLARASNTGRRDAARLAWNWLPRAHAARTRMQRTASRSSRP